MPQIPNQDNQEQWLLLLLIRIYCWRLLVNGWLTDELAPMISTSFSRQAQLLYVHVLCRDSSSGSFPPEQIIVCATSAS